jgi:hypothetical protein
MIITLMRRISDSRDTVNGSSTKCMMSHVGCDQTECMQFVQLGLVRLYDSTVPNKKVGDGVEEEMLC